MLPGHLGFLSVPAIDSIFTLINNHMALSAFILAVLTDLLFQFPNILLMINRQTQNKTYYLIYMFHPVYQKLLDLTVCQELLPSCSFRILFKIITKLTKDSH